MTCPMSMQDQVVVILAASTAFIVDYPVVVLVRYENAMLAIMRSRKSDILDTLRTTGKFDEGLDKSLRDALTEFAKTFSVDQKDGDN